MNRLTFSSQPGVQSLEVATFLHNACYDKLALEASKIVVVEATVRRAAVPVRKVLAAQGQRKLRRGRAVARLAPVRLSVTNSEFSLVGGHPATRAHPDDPDAHVGLLKRGMLELLLVKSCIVV